MLPQISQASSDRQGMMTVAAEQNAEFVIILEREELNDGALLKPHCGSLFNIHVNVRGLSVENRKTVLLGNAHYPHCIERSDTTLQNLTCQALATAWGFRPSGRLDSVALRMHCRPNSAEGLKGRRSLLRQSFTLTKTLDAFFMLVKPTCNRYSALTQIHFVHERTALHGPFPRSLARDHLWKLLSRPWSHGMDGRDLAHECLSVAFVIIRRSSRV